jgi:hypothetical protein
VFVRQEREIGQADQRDHVVHAGALVDVQALMANAIYHFNDKAGRPTNTHTNRISFSKL